MRKPGIRIEDDYEESVGPKWWSAPSPIAGWANDALRPHYAWSDKVADHYGDRYRSAFLYGFLGAVVAVALALIRVALLVADLPEVVELDVNPLVAHAGGVVALDARVRNAPASGPAHARLAIRPYPSTAELSLCNIG